jgi:hypothetical protein
MTSLVPVLENGGLDEFNGILVSASGAVTEAAGANREDAWFGMQRNEKASLAAEHADLNNSSEPGGQKTLQHQCYRQK